MTVNEDNIINYDYLYLFNGQQFTFNINENNIQSDKPNEKQRYVTVSNFLISKTFICLIDVKLVLYVILTII